MRFRGGEGCFPTRSQLLRHAQVHADAKGQGRNRMGHQGSDKRSGIFDKIVLKIYALNSYRNFCRIAIII